MGEWSQQDGERLLPWARVLGCGETVCCCESRYFPAAPCTLDMFSAEGRMFVAEAKRIIAETARSL